MAVVYYQIAIVVSVAIAYRVRPTLGLIAACSWTVFTLSTVYTAKLMAIELSVSWATYVVMRSLSQRDAALTDLRIELQRCSHVSTNRVSTLRPGELEFIAGPDHVRVLRGAIQDAQESVYVLSGWISDGIVNGEILELLGGALARGVNVSLGFGFADSQGTHRPFEASERALNSLRALYRRSRDAGWPGKLRVAKFANHEKLLIRDDSMVVCGSNNWLSNSQFKNSERSVAVYNREFVRAERERAERVISEHAPEQ